MYSRRGNKEKVIAIAFKISTHLASIVAYSITYIQVLEQVQFWGNSLQSCDLNIYERGYNIKGIQFLNLGHNIFSVFRNRWSKKKADDCSWPSTLIIWTLEKIKKLQFCKRVEKIDKDENFLSGNVLKKKSTLFKVFKFIETGSFYSHRHELWKLIDLFA